MTPLQTFQAVIGKYAGQKLPSNVRRDIINAGLREIEEAPQGMGAASDYLEAARDAGLGIRTQDFYAVFNETKDRAYYTAIQDEYDDETPIARSDMPVAPFNARSPYVYRVSVEMEGDEQYDGGDRVFYMRSDENLSKEDVVSEFYERYAGNFAGQGVDWDTLKHEKSYKGKLPR